MPDRPLPVRLRALLGATLSLLVLAPAAAGAAETGGSILGSMTEQQGGHLVEASLGPEPREAPPARVVAKRAPEPEAPRGPARIATVGGVELLDVSTETLAIGFHEGATRSRSLSPVTEVPEGTPRPVVLPSRGRGTGATTAVDIAVPAGTAITAPVTGEVVEANTYALYGATEDFLVTIAPSEAPGLRVRLFHLDDPRVAVGDDVVAGKTVIAGKSRQLSIASQIDRVSGKRTPHVHLQVDGS